MPVTINGTTGITDADGGTVLSSADIATQAEAQAGTDNTKLMTPLRVSQVPSKYTRYQLFTASGTFNTPAGVTEGFVVVVGGGGGGAGGPNGTTAGGAGGLGGVAVGILSLSGSMAVTVGAGGAGTNANANGAAGSSSVFSTLTATGGGAGLTVGSNGADGSGSGTGLLSSPPLGSLANVLQFVCVPALVNVVTQSGTRQRGASLTAAIPYSLTSTLLPGSGGAGEGSDIANNAAGGVDGAVFIFY